MMTKTIGLVTGLLALCFGSAVAGNSIVDIASRDSNFDILTRALKRTGLDETLDQSGPFTVLAPTDRAFRRLFHELGLDGLPDVDNDTLETILLYHVISGKVYSDDLSDGLVETVGGSEVEVDVRSRSGRIFFNDAEVVAADIKARNGVIHVIDEVLIPPSPSEEEEEESSLPTIVELVSGDNRFNKLVSCLAAADLVDAAVDLDGATLFAPTNHAFSRLFHALGIDDCGDVPTATLQEILLYHVVGGVALSDDLSNGQRIPTLEGSRLKIRFRRNGRKVFVDHARIIDFDLLASNGVVHVINRVLAP